MPKTNVIKTMGSTTQNLILESSSSSGSDIASHARLLSNQVAY